MELNTFNWTCRSVRRNSEQDGAFRKQPVAVFSEQARRREAESIT